MKLSKGQSKRRWNHSKAFQPCLKFNWTTAFAFRTEAGLGSYRFQQVVGFLLVIAVCGIGCQSSDVSSQPITPRIDDNLASRCERAAYLLEGQLNDDFSIVVRPPFILAGDQDRASLVDYYERRIMPARRALSVTYSLAKPTNPISIIACHSELSYVNVSQRLFQIVKPSSFGYYRPTERTLVVNEASGQDALAHELTHALFAQDWPDMPLWLNEGIASLHESCQFADEQPWLRPRDNWRLPIAQQSIRDEPNGVVHRVVGQSDFHNDVDGSKYALARYFSWFLHARGVLPSFVDALKAASRREDGRIATREQIDRLCEVFQQPLEAIDQDFKEWLAGRSG